MRKNFLEEEIIETIYFGGGTPSLLSQSELEQIFNQINKHFKISDHPEITIEANPDDLNLEKIKFLARSPVNRLSIGIQSFHQEDLEWMNRAHNKDEAIRSLNLAFEYGFEDITIDLIYGIPGSSHSKWEKNLEKTCTFPIPHLSLYALTIEEKTALHHFVKTGQSEVKDDVYINDQFLMANKFLISKGYVHYEISNYAKKERYAKHNSNYWTGKSYLGIGPGAHSYSNYIRSYNIPHNPKYIENINDGKLPLETEKLGSIQRYNEYIMLGLRTMWGIDQNKIKEDFPEYYPKFLNQLKKLQNLNWIIQKKNKIVLTENGKCFADAASVELFMD